MKKILVILFAAALMLPASVMAEISVLKGYEYCNGYDLEEGVWEKYNDDVKLFFVIDAEPGTPHFTVNSAEIFNYWKEKEGGETFKYYRRLNLIDMEADLQIADLDVDNKVELTVSLSLIEGDKLRLLLGLMAGETNKKDYIKNLKGLLIIHAYDEGSGDIVEFQKVKWDIYRTKDFDDPELTAEQIADDIEQYFEGKGYEEED